MPTEEQLTKMKTALDTAEENLAIMKTEIDLAKRADIDVSAQELEYSALRARVLKMRAVYGI